jgi:uracil-DNA glycosylase
MDTKLDFETFKPKLGLWANKFKPFIESKEMWDIMQTIKNDARYPDGRRKEVIVPENKDTFRAFSTVNPGNIKVIFYLMDPYPRYYKDGKTMQATGIAMDCSNSPDGKLQPSLENWYDAMDNELGDKVLRSKDLTYLHQQGVMMLNTDLTCKLNKTQSHEGLWEPFQKYFLEQVVGSDTQIIYVLCGKSSERMERYINPFCTIFKLSHPAAASHTHTDWDSKGVFTKINRIIKDHNGGHIFWDKRDWDEQKPF